VYARDDAEKEHLIKSHFKGSKNVDIGRFKGLGEMLPAQLRDTTMHREKRTLLRVTIGDNEGLAQFVDRLMGKNAEARYIFIQENAPHIHDVDV
jgi:topoisomerase-4 subunit B